MVVGFAKQQTMSKYHPVLGVERMTTTQAKALQERDQLENGRTAIAKQQNTESIKGKKHTLISLKYKLQGKQLMICF